MGRPSKYTPKRVGAIVAAISVGKTEDIAAHEAGIHVSTIADWKVRYPEFSDEIAHARARYDEKLLGNVRRHANNQDDDRLSLAASTWLLSKRNRLLYGNHTIIAGDKENPLEVTGEVDRSLAKRIDEMPLEDVRAMIAASAAVKR